MSFLESVGSWFLENEMVAILLSLCLGHLIGKINFGRFTLGSTVGTLLVAMIIGQSGTFSISSTAQMLFFMLCVFAIGYESGPAFVKGFRNAGMRVIGLSLFFVVVGTGLTVGLCKACGLDAGTSAGIFAGSLTQTAVIGTAGDAIASLGLDEATTELVRAYVEEKNMLAIELLLRGNGAAEAAIARIRELPMLFGGAEVFARAEKLSAYPKCREALQNLRAIYDALCACGFENFVTIDLGMVHAIGYYTGMIFRGISASFGQPLLSGGRYDGLMRDFGRPLCAVGFAMGLEHVQEALERQAGPAEAPGLDALLVVGDAPLSRAWQRAEALRAQGQSVELCYATDEAEIAALARARRARRVIREEEAL